MKIGQVAAEAGVSIDTVRFYERRGVLPAPARTASGYRIYPEQTVARLRLARRLQDLGLTLDEIAGALRAHDEGRASCQAQRWRLEAALERVESKLAELARLHGDLRRQLAACESGRCELAPPAPAGGH